MTWRTPPSLKWLIVKRSRTSGLISRLTDERDELSARLDRVNQLIPRLERQLQALDVTFELHDNEDDEVLYWTTELEVTEDKLRDTVRSVGVMVVDVRRALGKI